MVSKDRRSTKPKKGRARHGGRVVLSLDVESRIRDALRDRAAVAGVSMAEYLANALARPERSYVTAAVEIAQPLAQVSYHLAQAERAIRGGQVDVALGEIDAARQIVVGALAPLQRRHAQEVRVAERRRGGGWTG